LLKIKDLVASFRRFDALINSESYIVLRYISLRTFAASFT
jgi:hypothetical protein